MKRNRDSFYGFVSATTGQATILAKDRLQNVRFSNPFSKKHSDHECHESGFRFNPLNPGRVGIHRIHNPFLDFHKQTKNPFLDSESGFGFSPKKCTLNFRKISLLLN